MSSNKHNGSKMYFNGLKVKVDNNNIDSALRKLKKLITNEGVIRDLRRKEFYEKPSVVKRREKAEAKNRWKRTQRKLEDY